jgi:hypothetical protein
MQKLRIAGKNSRALFDWAGAQDNNALSAVARASIISWSVCFVEGIKDIFSSWIYATIWHVELICSSRDSRPSHRTSRHASSGASSCMQPE